MCTGPGVLADAHAHMRPHASHRALPASPPGTGLQPCPCAGGQGGAASRALGGSGMPVGATCPGLACPKTIQQACAVTPAFQGLESLPRDRAARTQPRRLPRPLLSSIWCLEISALVPRASRPCCVCVDGTLSLRFSCPLPVDISASKSPACPGSLEP